MDWLTKYSKETTHENGVCCTHFDGMECFACNGDCSRGCTWEEAAWRRLAAYEDTGLEPREVSAIVKEWSDLCTVIGECGGIDRLRELAEADKDGRLVVLPCKVGDTLWVTGRDNVPRKMSLEAPDIRTVCTDEDNLCMSTCNRKPDGFCAYRLRNDGADIGKTVFLTYEEAEKALKTKEG